jgi:hypothetical protein
MPTGRKREPKKLLEKDIQKLIVDYLKMRRVPYALTNAERVWSKYGYPIKSKVSPDHPDLSATMPVLVNGNPIGLSFYIEVKTETGALRDGQRIRLTQLAEVGSICTVARCLEDVEIIVNLFYNKELDHQLLRKTKELLMLKLADRRKKEIRDALKSFSFTE